MKKAIPLLLCILISLSLFSCSQQEAVFYDLPVTQFEANELHTKVFEEFTFQYPAEWSVEIENDPAGITDFGTIFGIFSPHGSSGYPASFLIVMAKNQKIETTDIKKEYVESLLEDMTTETGNAYEITDFGYYNLGGEQVVIYTAKTTVENVEAFVTQAMYVKDTTLYIFNLNTYAEENTADTNAILSSVLFKSAQDPDHVPDLDNTDSTDSTDNADSTDPATDNTVTE
ncbi:MAG: hypothetical protein IKM61_02115 [Eubacteriaceae bacterium]|nr:hypothetical protein [Eubacteriaceae bacterium]